jgi:putative membrane protein
MLALFDKPTFLSGHGHCQSRSTLPPIVGGSANPPGDPMKANSLTLLSSAALALAVSFGAQAQNTSAKLSGQDKSFIKDAAEAGNAEVEGSKVALDKSGSADVKTFAQMMVDDHGKAGAELKGLAEQKGVKVSDTPSMTKKAEIKMLSERKGASFDQHYADSIGVKAHQDTVKLFQKEVDKGTDADVKAWASKTLPTLQHHLEAAQALKAKADAEPKS